METEAAMAGKNHLLPHLWNHLDNRTQDCGDAFCTGRSHPGGDGYTWIFKRWRGFIPRGGADRLL